MNTEPHAAGFPSAGRPLRAPDVAPPSAAISAAGPDSTITILLIEDDPGDAFLVQELLDETALKAELRWVHTLAEAAAVLASVTAVSPDGAPHCVLLDLALPDADGLDALHAILRTAPSTAVIVLTGLADEYRGIGAVAAGAQDYLVKGQVEAELLSRAIRFAVERKRADENAHRLREAELWAQENSRLERGLLAAPLLGSAQLSCLTRYQPGRQRALLGGDFYDAVATADGTVFAVVGDVMGHGPDGAALGVCLRVAWRTLVLAETPEQRILPTLNKVIAAERRTEEVFATVCMIVVEPRRTGPGRVARLYLAGHPAPVKLAGDIVERLPEEPSGPALGLFTDPVWPPIGVDVSGVWSMLLYTDGLIEGRVAEGTRRLGEDGLVRLVHEHLPSVPVSPEWPDELIALVESLNGDALTDDVAVLVLSEDGPTA